MVEQRTLTLKKNLKSILFLRTFHYRCLHIWIDLSSISRLYNTCRLMHFIFLKIKGLRFYICFLQNSQFVNYY